MVSRLSRVGSGRAGSPLPFNDPTCPGPRGLTRPVNRPINPVSAAVLFWGQNTQIPSGFYPQNGTAVLQGLMAVSLREFLSTSNVKEKEAFCPSRAPGLDLTVFYIYTTHGMTPSMRRSTWIASCPCILLF